MRISVSLFTAFLLIFSISCAQEPDNQVSTPTKVPFTAELLIDEMQIPWGIAFLPDGGLLVTEKSGELIHFLNGQKTKVSNIPEIYVRGQGGFMDVALHPDYENNGWIYFSYSSNEGEGKGGNTAISRAKLKDNSLTNNELIYKGSPNTSKGQHFGSRIVFDKKGYLYFSIGDRGARDENPQNIKKDGGKIYRLNADGSIPADNPFVGKEEAKTAIYSYGHRNPQGLTVHPETDAVWNHEHGPRGGDEINIVEKGANFGWPVITYGINYSGTTITDKTKMNGMEQPIHYWVPSIAPSGMAFVTTDSYDGWKGSLLVGSLAFQYLERLEMDGSKVISRERLLDGLGRVRDVRQGPDGLIYVAVEGKGVYKLTPKE